MLGRLARYLRAAGYDAAYFKKIDDLCLIDIAISQNRIILTRDTLMYKSKSFQQKKPDIAVIKSDNYKEQLKQLKSQLGLKLEASFNRCISCNAELQQADKQYYKHSIPSYVYRTFDHFMICPCCRNIYWQGSHCQSLKKTLESI